jgi:hypothetical protein
MREVLLLDRHDGKMRLSLRVLVESEADTIACACATRPEVERWLDSPHPMLSINAVALGHQGRGEPDAMTRTSELTLTGVQARELFELEELRVGRRTVRIVDDWPPGARFAGDAAGRQGHP